MHEKQKKGNQVNKSEKKKDKRKYEVKFYKIEQRI